MLKTPETKEQGFKVTIHHHCFGVHIDSPTWIFSVFILIYYKHTFDFLSYLLLSDTIYTIIMSHAVWCVATFF